MRPEDLDLRELLELEPGGVRYVGQQALVLEATALGLLRKELIDTIGPAAARAILTRLGYALGWRAADSLASQYRFEDPLALCRAGAFIYAAQGVIAHELTAPRLTTIADLTWQRSFEAEQHLLHVGRADRPACWTLAGVGSGFLSRAFGREIEIVEDRCLARGDDACHVFARSPGRSRSDDYSTGDAAPRTLDASLERVTAALKRAERRLRERRRALELVAPDGEDASALCARSAAMRRAVEVARRAAEVDSTVLVTGETGVGKERIARFIHERSARAGWPFVAVNGGAVAESLLESELFGHARGAFTGATRERAGLFEAAEGGTLFLDEVGDMPPAMQVKLLRVLQDHEVRRVGENAGRRVDVRVVAATHRDLREEVAAGRFRNDLYYRLKVVELEVPPLRSRREDVLPLALELLEAAAARIGRRIEGIAPRAADLLLGHDWPGNVRELENAMARVAALAQGARVEPEDLPREVRRAAPSAAPRQSRPLCDVEREHILAVLARHDNNQARAAAALGIGTTTLYRKLKSYRAEGDG